MDIVVDILEMGMFISNYFNTMFSLWWDASLSLSLCLSLAGMGAWDASGMIWIDMMGCLILEWCGMMGHWPNLLSIHLRWTQASHFVATCQGPPNFFLPETFLPKTLRKSLITQRLTRVNHVELNIRLQCNTKEIPAREHDQAREYSTPNYTHYQSPNTNPVPLTPPNPQKKGALSIIKNLQQTNI